MIKNHLNIKLLRNVLRQVLRAIDRAVLPSGATEGEHKICKLALYVALHVSIFYRLVYSKINVYLS